MFTQIFFILVDLSNVFSIWIERRKKKRDDWEWEEKEDKYKIISAIVWFSRSYWVWVWHFYSVSVCVCVCVCCASEWEFSLVFDRSFWSLFFCLKCEIVQNVPYYVCRFAWVLFHLVRASNSKFYWMRTEIFAKCDFNRI